MPLFNEADKISTTIAGLEQAFSNVGIAPTYIIQDDASTDSSLEVLSTLAQRYLNRVEVEQNSQNRGHGPTVMRAYVRALALNPEVIVHVDSDGEIDPQAAVRCALQVIEADTEAVIGARFDRNSPWHRRAVTRLLRLAILIFFGVRSDDVNSPVRAYQSPTLSKLTSFVPADAVTPHVLLTVLTHKISREIVYLPAESASSSLPADEGSTWKSSNRLFGIPTRFLKLVARAFKELVVFRFAIRRQY